MRKANIGPILALGSVLLLGTACEQPSGNSDPVSPAITAVEWNVYVQDPSITTEGIGIKLNAEVVCNSGVSESAVASCSITAPDNGTWAATYDTYLDWDEGSLIMSGLYDGDSLTAMPAGTWTATVTLTDGSVLIKTFSVVPPGTTTLGAYTSISTTSSDSSTAAALALADITAAAISATELTVTLNTHDDRVENVYFYLYNAAGNYIGITPYVVNMNGGTSLRNAADGTVWTAAIPLSYVDLTSGSTYADVASIICISTDGKQFSEGYTFRHRSRSLAFSL